MARAGPHRGRRRGVRDRPDRPRTNNLPAPLTSFVGRKQESEDLEQALVRPRLVTLTGPGGAGKTRLAREVTARLVDDFTDGVWFVPMAPVSSPLDVPQAVPVALGVPDAGPAGDVRAVIQPLDRLADVLTDRRLILVLDNCEHLIDAVAGLADRVLAGSPGLRILATSREPLGITGETLCPVPSLDGTGQLHRGTAVRDRDPRRPDGATPDRRAGLVLGDERLRGRGRYLGGRRP